MARLIKHGDSHRDAPCITNKAHPCILLAGEEIRKAVVIPIGHRGSHHAQIRFYRTQKPVENRTPAGKAIFLFCANILEVCEGVNKIARKKIKIAVAVPIGKQRNSRTVYVYRLSVGETHHLRPAPLLLGGGSGFVADIIDVSVQRSVRPASCGIVCILPAIFLPVSNPHNKILASVIIEVRETPNISANPVRMHVIGKTGELLCVAHVVFAEVIRDNPKARYRKTAIGTNLRGSAAISSEPAASQKSSGLEHRIKFPGTSSIFEKPRAAAAAWHTVRKKNHIQVTVAVIVHYHRPSAETSLQKGRAGRVEFESRELT